jgi:hypothetical protein
VGGPRPGAGGHHGSAGVHPARSRAVLRGIAIAEVRWPWLDSAGVEKGDEVSTYVFRRDDAGKLKIQAVIMHGASSDM